MNNQKKNHFPIRIDNPSRRAFLLINGMEAQKENNTRNCKVGFGYHKYGNPHNHHPSNAIRQPTKLAFLQLPLINHFG